MSGKCPVCGAPMENDVCGYCGYVKKAESVDTVININNNLVNAEVNNHTVRRAVSDKSKMVALLLCVFLGVLGIHRFYVGKIGTGVLYLFTAGIFGFGWIIDIIIIVLGNFTDDNNNYLR